MKQAIRRLVKAIRSNTGIVRAVVDPRDRKLTFALFGSAAAIVAVVALRQVPETFDSASDLGDVVLALASGYVAAWFFHYLTVWRPKAIAWLTIGPQVARLANQLAGASALFADKVVSSAGKQRDRPYDAAELKEWLSGLSPTTETDMIDIATRAPLTLNDAARERRQHVESLVLRLDRWADHLDPVFLRYVHEVSDCTFMRVAWQFDEPSRYGGRASDVIKWMTACDELSAYLRHNHPAELAAAGLDPTIDSRTLSERTTTDAENT